MRKQKITVLQCVVWPIGLLCLILQIMSGSVYNWAYENAKHATPQAQKNLYPVLTSYRWFSITGESWEEELEKQIKSVQNKPLTDRVSFYRWVLVYCANDLDTSRMLIFWEGIGNDKQALLDDLRSFQVTPEYTQVNNAGKEMIVYYIDALQNSVNLDKKFNKK
jgi:hypothetical protein